MLFHRVLKIGNSGAVRFAFVAFRYKGRLTHRLLYKAPQRLIKGFFAEHLFQHSRRLQLARLVTIGGFDFELTGKG